jgi:hypothetical protein
VLPRILGCSSQREWAALGIAADGPPRAGMDDRAAELADPLERSRQVADGEVGEGGGVPGTRPALMDPRRRPPTSISHPEPPSVGLGRSSTPSTPRQKRRARSGSSAGNSISGAGISRVCRDPGFAAARPHPASSDRIATAARRERSNDPCLLASTFRRLSSSFELSWYSGTPEHLRIHGKPSRGVGDISASPRSLLRRDRRRK